MHHLHTQTDAPGARRSHEHGSGRLDLRTQDQRISPTVARALFERELAYYRADEPYLGVEKCAERCQRLSLLLTAATLAPGDRP